MNEKEGTTSQRESLVLPNFRETLITEVSNQSEEDSEEDDTSPLLKRVVEKRDKTFCSLFSAAQKGDAEKLEAYLETRSYLVTNFVNSWGQNLLHIAANTETASLVLRYIPRMDINAECKRRQTPLRMAVKKGDQDLVLFLINQGANVNHVRKQRSILDVLYDIYESETDKDMKSRFAEISSILNSYGAKTFLELLNSDNPHDLRKISLNTLRMTHTEYGKNLLHLTQSSDVAWYLIRDVGIKVDSEYTDKKTPLYYAVTSANYTLTESLIQLGANANIIFGNGEGTLLDIVEFHLSNESIKTHANRHNELEKIRDLLILKRAFKAAEILTSLM